MENDLKIKGHVTISYHYQDGTTETVEFDNLVVNTGLSMLVNGLSGASSKITYVAVGTSTTLPVAGDTRLGNEAFRKPITSYSLGNNVLTTTTYFIPTDAVNVNIQEIGWFGGSANGNANTGTLYAHAQYPNGGHMKTNLESLTITRTDTLTSN